MTKTKPPRLLIEEWLPAAAIGVECMRERGSASALAPHTYLHVWWARRPLTASRAAVLGSLLPADFPHDVFERLLGFGQIDVKWDKLREQHVGTGVLKQLEDAIKEKNRSKQLLALRSLMDSGVEVGGFGCDRAFKAILREEDLLRAHKAAEGIWGNHINVIDPMAGGGSIPLESARLGFRTLANELNPVACSVLEATVDYPFRYGMELAIKARKWGDELRRRFNGRMDRFFPKKGLFPTGIHIFAHTVPCPDTQFHTPLVPDWHLLKPKGSNIRVWAEPVVDKKRGIWSVEIVDSRRIKRSKELPKATYKDGKGISIFTGTQIPAEYIKAKAQAGEMHSALYAIELIMPDRKEFVPPDGPDIRILAEAETELKKCRHGWEKNNLIPTELYPDVTTDERPRLYGMPHWADMFSARQLLGFAVLVEELKSLQNEIIKADGKEIGEAVEHLLALVIDKFLNYNSILGSWHAPRSVMRSVFDRHDFAFKATFAEMAPCTAGLGLEWAIDNTLEAYEHLAQLPRDTKSKFSEISQGSSTNLPHISDKSTTAVVVDPPYADNVQYSELADFFYVWLKRTQGHRRPEWFSTYLCDHTEEAVVNVARHKKDGVPPKEAKRRANEFYQRLMTDSFKEAHRILRDEGVLTVMFTHKKQEAWKALFTSLIQAGFTITATWPVKTESEHSLHQAKKNAAQSTVILVARKRPADAEVGWFDNDMKQAIRLAARNAAERLQKEGLNPVDQLVGSFGPAMEVYSKYTEVRTDTGDPVGVDRALDEASEAVSAFRIQQLAERGLEGVEAEGRFYLLCWDVLRAAEFRFNEAKLLGNAVGMDVDMLVAAGLVSKSGDKIKLLSAMDRRRPKKLEAEEMEETLFGSLPTGKKKRVRKGDVLKVHPNDSHFRTALDACHALALRFQEAGGGNPGTGSARQLAVQQGWKGGSPVAKLTEALVKAAPAALWFEKDKQSAAAQYPEFRAWHTLLEPLFGIKPPEWEEELAPQLDLIGLFKESDEEESSEDEESEEEMD
jgi:adenine-specific DNA methylase